MRKVLGTGQRALGELLTWGAGGLTEGLEEGIGGVAENLMINSWLRGWDPDTRTGRWSVISGRFM